MKDNLKQEIWDQSKEWINAIGEVINEMAKNLGIAAEHVYTVYTKQMFVEGLVWTVFLLALYITIITLTKVMYKWNIRHFHTDYHKQYTNYDDSMKLVPLAIGGAVFLLVFLFSASTLLESVMKIFNPEYYTLKYLMETAKDMVSK